MNDCRIQFNFGNLLLIKAFMPIEIIALKNNSIPFRLNQFLPNNRKFQLIVMYETQM